MHFCTECGTPLPDNKNFCPRCGKKAAAPESKPKTPAPDNQPPAPPKTARIHGTSGCTTSLIRGTRPIRGKKMATLNELHHLHNHYEEIRSVVHRRRIRKTAIVASGGGSNPETYSSSLRKKPTFHTIPYYPIDKEMWISRREKVTAPSRRRRHTVLRFRHTIL